MAKSGLTEKFKTDYIPLKTHHSSVPLFQYSIIEDKTQA